MTHQNNFKKAIILYEGNTCAREDFLSRILEFFYIYPKKMRILKNENGEMSPIENFEKCVIFGSITAYHKLLKKYEKSHEFPKSKSIAGIYLYATEDVLNCEKSLQSMTGFQNAVLKRAGDDTVCFKIKAAFPDLTGPFTGMQVYGKCGKKDFLFNPGNGNSQINSIISAGDKPVFFMASIKEIPCFINTSPQIPDLDAPLSQGCYDVKQHFCSAVPLVMFLKYSFSKIIRQPVEHGACLIIDDPLLRSRYGYCDFKKLLHQMKTQGFTTNVSFIPWNWRRTNRKNAAFFRRESNHFSVSIHGCDHTAAEFGSPNFANLSAKARLALARMKLHENHTGIHHDPIMVFPQGVFSQSCPEALKQAGYLAAVNTEISPFGNPDDKTRLRDVWDIAITRYGSFPIFTRRYSNHGLENFAFDLLLGKPCLIVGHHEFFKNNGEAVIDLVQKLKALNCNLKWRPLGEVLRRACQYLINDSEVREYSMYANELWVENDSDKPVQITVRKRENDLGLIDRIESGLKNLEWKASDGYIEFSTSLAGKEKGLCKVSYKKAHQTESIRRNLKYEMKVAARRILCELRDEGMYWWGR